MGFQPHKTAWPVFIPARAALAVKEGKEDGRCFHIHRCSSPAPILVAAAAMPPPVQKPVDAVGSSVGGCPHQTLTSVEVVAPNGRLFWNPRRIHRQAHGAAGPHRKDMIPVRTAAGHMVHSSIRAANRHRQTGLQPHLLGDGRFQPAPMKHFPQLAQLIPVQAGQVQQLPIPIQE